MDGIIRKGDKIRMGYMKHVWWTPGNYLLCMCVIRLGHVIGELERQ